MIKFKGGFKRIYGLVAFLVCVLTFLLIPLGKSNAIVVNNNGIMNRLFFMDRNTNKQILTAVKRDTAGNYIYCGEEQKDSPSGQDMWKDGTYNYQAYTLLSNGYPHRSFTGDPETDYFITQMAFWALVDSAHVNLDKLDAYVDYSKRDDVWNHAKWLYDLAKSAPENYTFSVGFNKGAINCVREGDNFVSDWITLAGSPGIDMESVHFSASNGVYCAYQLRNGNLVPDVPINMEFRVIVPVSQTQGSCTITATGNIRKPVVNRLTCSDPQVQKVGQYLKESEPYSSSFNLAWPTSGDLEILKQDAETGAVLSGAVFEVRKNGQIYNNTRLTTGANGKSQKVNLPQGNYTLVEVTAPSGYVLDSTPINVTIEASRVTSKTITNSKSKGKLKILKVNGEGQKLQGAEFKIYKKANNQLVETLVTNANGEALSEELEVGEYYFQETKAPIGYDLSSSRVDFSITTSTTILTKQVTNTKSTGRLTITKTDGSTGKLSGAEFTIYKKSDNSVVETLVTNSNGTATSSLLPLGDYYFKETKAPTGFVLDDTRVDFSLTASAKNVSKTVVNRPVRGNIRIVKTDSDTGAKLAGAVFKLYRKSDNAEIKTVTTNSQGFGNISDVPYGEYYVKEITAPNGYILDSTKKFVNITKDNETYEISAPNRKSTGIIRITKKEAGTNTTLRGAVFKVYNSSNNLVATLTTGANGQASTGALPLGSYRIEEVTAPAGYVKDSTPKTVNLATNGGTVDVNFTNRRISGVYKLVKKDSENNSLLQGAVFTIYNANNNAEVQTITTDRNGVAISSSIPFGSYYALEKTAPTGYNKSNQRYTFDVDTDGRTYEQTATNAPIKGRIKIVKKSEEGNTPLAGAVFKILDKAGNKVAQLTTGGDGTVTSDLLRFGEYTIQEITAPSGHVLNTTTKKVNISQNNNTYTVEFVNKVITGKLKIIKKDSENNNLLQGAVFTIYNADNNSEVQTITTNGDGVALSKDLKFGSYYILEKTAPTGFNKNTQRFNFDIDTNGMIFEQVVTNEPIKGRIKIVKKDKDNPAVAIAGAVFKILDNGGTEVARLTTGNDGTVTSDLLRYGEYTVQEVKASTGYVLNATPQTVNISKHNTTYSVEFINEKIKGKLKVIKTDGKTITKLAGAIFTVYEKGTNKEFTKVVTDKNGEAVTGWIPYGEYYFKETQAPEGYVLDGTIREFNVDTNAKVYQFKIDNEKITSRVKITKTDEETGTKLQGAKFGIFKKSNNSKVLEVTTGNDGTVTSEPIEYGEYYAKELTPPAAYTLNPKHYDITVRNHGAVIEVNATDRIIKGRVKIKKVDEETNKTLKGAIFAIYKKVDNTEVCRLTTGDDGTITSGLLNYGEYYFKEIQPPTGYNLNSTRVDFKIEREAHTYEFTARNRIIKGRIKITKTDIETNAVLKGGVFQVFNAKDDSLVCEVTTGNDGTVTTELLNYGDYYVKEKTPPIGYTLNTNRFNVEVREEGKVHPVEVANRIIKGRIKIIKSDEETGKKLENAKFELFTKDNVKLADLVTDANGEVTTDLLNYGEYYVKEKVPPVGYNINPNKFNVNITEDGKVYVVEITNRIIKGKLEIIKVDAENLDRLEGAVFKVYAKADNREMATLTTNKNGELLSPLLNYGDYYFKEITPPEGFLLNTNAVDFSIREEGKIYSFDVTNNPIKGKIVIDKKDNDLKDLAIPSVEFEVRDKDNKLVATLVTDENGHAETDWLRYGKYTITEKKPKEGYLDNITVHEIFIREHQKSYNINVFNQIIKGKIQIVKIDENHEEKPVGGAEFTIYAENVFGISKSTEVAKVVTDKDGFAVTDDLRYGIYKIVETKTPEGYFKSDKEYFINIKENSKTYVRYISNKPIESKILVSKTDEVTGEPLEGVKFEIRNKETKEPLVFTKLNGKGKAVEEFTEFETDEEGTFLTPQAVPFGEWELVEKKPLYNYVEIEPVAFSMAETTPMEDIEGIGTVTDMDLTNDKITGTLEITKLFSPTEISGNDTKYTNPREFYEMRDKGFVEPKDFKGEDYPLAYATFNLYKLDCEVLPSKEDRDKLKWKLVGEYETNMNGQLILDDLEYGAYKLEEINTPDNFKDVEDVFFDIEKDGDVFKTTIINEVKIGDVEITKVDIHDGTLLPNAHFEILDKDKNIVLSGITDENGLFKFKLPAGKYYYKETQAPVFEGTEYILDDGEYPFEIKEDGEIVKCKAPNKKKITPKTSAIGVGGIGIGVGVITILVILFLVVRNKRR
ncbi:SpaA isopeptide-forming pilin-related protein [uncultured Clostridium sp.]|uniref:SpaA isopeptide-forming pilin-related protein n=1 Tax=uncultured Clostridium sp. TaxID=59620 RepID=UPI0026F3C05B|nr:SpaA isopeptide-forming pilin-related protein [uncultured Clostridium sp.]